MRSENTSSDSETYTGKEPTTTVSDVLTACVVFHLEEKCVCEREIWNVQSLK